MLSLLDDATIIGLSHNYVSSEMMGNTDCGSAEFYRGYVSAMVCVLNSARPAGNAASYLKAVERLDDSVAVPPQADERISGAKFGPMNAHSYGRYARDNPGTPLGDVFATLNEEEPLRYHRTFGLDAEQLDELEELIEELLTEPWDKGTGRPKSLSLREAIMVTLLYTRQNLMEEAIADLFDVAQSTVSEIVTKFTPLIARVTEEFRPHAEEAKQMTRGRMALVDGTLWPCWSWETAPEMWAGKYKTTGHGSLIIGDESGNIIFVSDPAPGRDHDMKKLNGEVEEILELAGAVIADKGFQGSGYVTPAKKPIDRELYLREREYNNQISSIRSPIERAVAHLKARKILFTDYRRPLHTFLDSFQAAVGLYFFELSFR